MIDKSKQYKTRSGLPVKIYATDCGGKYPVHGAMLEGEEWSLFSWTEEGKMFADQTAVTDMDLIEVKPRIKRTYYMNVYTLRSCADAAIHSSREDADEFSSPHRIACIEIEIDCEEGEGL